MASRVPTSCGPLFGSWILNSNGASLSNTTVWPSDKDGSISSIAEKSKAFNTDYWLRSATSGMLPYGSINLELEFIILKVSINKAKSFSDAIYLNFILLTFFLIFKKLI